MARVKVATVGAGYFSQFHHDAWSRLPEATVVAVCDSDIEKARAFARRWRIPAVYTDVETMLEEARPDLLDIITPPEIHLTLIRLAADRHVPVLCQRPFCRTIAEAEEAVTAAEQARISLVVHENFRFQPWYQEIGRILGERKLGEVWQAQFRLRTGDGAGPDAYLDRYPVFRTMPRFLVHESGISFIDMVRFLFGEIRTVLARLIRLNPVISGEDAGFILFETESGVRVLFDGNRLADRPARNRHLVPGDFLAEGSGGSLRLDGDARILMREVGRSEESEHSYAWEDSGHAGDSVLRLQRHVVAHIADGTPLVNGARDYIPNLRVAEAVYRSAETGTVVSLATPAAVRVREYT